MDNLPGTGSAPVDQNPKFPHNSQPTEKEAITILARPTTARPQRPWASLMMIGMLLLILFPRMTVAQPKASQSAGDLAAADDILDDALNSELADLATIEQSLKRWEALKASTIEEIETYRVQNAAHRNMMLALMPSVEDLQADLNENRLAIQSLSGRIAEFEKIGVIATQKMAQLSDRLDIAERQMADLKGQRLSEADRHPLKKKLDTILDMLRTKKRQGEQFLRSFNTISKQLNDLFTELTETGNQIEKRLRQQAQSNLFQKTHTPFSRLRINSLSADYASTKSRMKAILKAGFWKAQWVNIKRSGSVTQSVFLILFAVAVTFRRKIRRYFRRAERRMKSASWRNRRLGLYLLRRSFVLICALLLLWLYDRLRLPHINFSFARFLNQSVLTLLFTRWGIDFTQRYWKPTGSPLQSFVRKRLLFLVRMLRILGITYFLFVCLIGNESLLVWMLRLSTEGVLLVWMLSFWRHMKAAGILLPSRQEAPLTHRALLVVALWLSYLVAGGALLLELTGYHILAGYWLASWSGTQMLGLWAFIGWQSIQEWSTTRKATSPSEGTTAPAAVAAPVGWFMIQMARLFWLTTVLAGGLLVWSSTNFMIAALKQIFSLDFSVGSLSFSVKGLLLAVIIVCLTHMATRIGRRLLGEKVLDARNFERGLKDSIITISSYVIWAVGLILALGLLGVNATSLAVVFGALSIGIGFGLQNIFNNFISGLILLFERPIQVGDYVEINGMWAEVKRINVRATIVQTFDNATVIIPNSDFISQQVTNWSFKDQRMRRHVDVGVAYGSDIELVRSTLLEIADGVPQILKVPSPDVLFLDHGDSALVFRLRYWTHVDNYFSTSTDIRFKLDERFRERGIEIAFPQRDLHIRSADPGIFSADTPASGE